MRAAVGNGEKPAMVESPFNHKMTRGGIQSPRAQIIDECGQGLSCVGAMTEDTTNGIMGHAEFGDWNEALTYLKELLHLNSESVKPYVTGCVARLECASAL